MTYKLYFDDRWEKSSGGYICSHTTSDIDLTEIESTNNDHLGFYAYVVETDRGVIAGVDHIRSIPLFYATVSDKLYLSNDSDWIVNQLSEHERSKLINTEYELAGYVTGRDTRHPKIKQLLPGEKLYWEDNKLEIISKSAFTYSKQRKQKSVQDAVEVAEGAVKRLIEYANGRQIVIPLSGGLDSRLIAGLIEKNGYQNVFSFTYGRTDTPEVSIAEQRAASLNIEWEHIRYDHEKWKQWYRSEHREQLYDINDNIKSIPHIEMGPALVQLKADSLVDTDAIVVPGHTGDMISGGHFPKSLYIQDCVSRSDIADLILKNHYSLDEIPDGMKTKLKQRIIKKLDVSNSLAPDLAYEAYESWDFRNRQAGFIINSMRAVESSNFDWYLPLWDKDLMNFWLDVPVKQRLNKKLYKKAVSEVWGEATKEDEQTSLITDRDVDPKTESILTKTKRNVSKSPINKVLKPIYDRYIIPRTHYHAHPLGWYGIVPHDCFKRIYQRDSTINTFLSKDILEKINLEG